MIMKKTLEKIRSKPPEVRMTIALILAIVCTGIVGAGWIMTLSGGSKKIKSDAPSPLTALTGVIKDAVVNPNKNSNTEIIDVSNPDTTHDESNPYQTTPASPEATQGTQ